MKKNQPCNTLIIGAGPAGLFAGIMLKNRKVILLEKNSRPGKKLLISGSGRCNITHTGNIKDFFSHYGDHHRFLKTALLEFTNENLLDFLHHSGLTTTVDKNGKVFPASDHAKDVLNILLNECISNNTDIQTGMEVKGIENYQGSFIIHTSEIILQAQNLIIATGGKSYPGTGSTGDGYEFARSLGHSIVSPTPALTPVFIKDYHFSELAGVSLDTVPLSLYHNNKKIREHFGDIGFTHQGLSGPGILDFSRYITGKDTLKVNFSGENPEVFRNKIIETSSKSGKIGLQTYLKQYNLPKSLVKNILFQCTLDPDTNIAMLDKKARNLLVEMFCEYPFYIEKKGGFSMAMTTAGGVSLEEVDPRTMQSRLIPNLFFAGEVLNIDGDTGGYNLQAAFSTAFLAAKAINGES
ncbi:MAG: NAD(P)/FAD-dependent oxidoreductase [Bacteroidales bacterium]